MALTTLQQICSEWNSTLMSTRTQIRSWTQFTYDLTYDDYNCSMKCHSESCSPSRSADFLNHFFTFQALSIEVQMTGETHIFLFGCIASVLWHFFSWYGCKTGYLSIYTHSCFCAKQTGLNGCRNTGTTITAEIKCHMYVCVCVGAGYKWNLKWRWKIADRNHGVWFELRLKPFVKCG